MKHWTLICRDFTPTWSYLNCHSFSLSLTRSLSLVDDAIQFGRCGSRTEGSQLARVQRTNSQPIPSFLAASHKSRDTHAYTDTRCYVRWNVCGISWMEFERMALVTMRESEKDAESVIERKNSLPNSLGLKSVTPRAVAPRLINRPVFVSPIAVSTRPLRFNLHTPLLRVLQFFLLFLAIKKLGSTPNVPLPIGRSLFTSPNHKRLIINREIIFIFAIFIVNQHFFGSFRIASTHKSEKFYRINFAESCSTIKTN